MKSRATLIIAALAIAASFAIPSAQSGYKTPPKVIADIMDAEPLPGVSLSRDRATMLLSYRQSMPSLNDVMAPWIGLAGSRINPRTNGPHTLGGSTSLVLKDVATGADRKLALPAGGTFSASFSPDSRKVAITHTTDDAIRLLVADVATGQVTTVLDEGINALAGGCGWLDTTEGFFCRLIPAGRGAAPERPRVPNAPNIQETAGRLAPGRTYQDLLTNPYDEQLYDYYYTSQLAFVDLSGKVTPAGRPAIYQGANLSTDEQYLIVTRLKRPYSYLVPSSQFPRDVELWDRAGNVVRTLASVPMGDTIPTLGVFAGPRSFTWHPLEPATLFWTEALDKGDPKVDVPHRDRVVTLKAPFTGEPAEVVKTQWRYGGMSFTEKGAVFASEFDRPSRMRRTWIYDNGFASAPRKVWELRTEDRYGDPGSPMFRPGAGAIMQVGDDIYLTSSGPTPTGDRPFLDRFNLKTLKSTRVWQSGEDAYESVVALLDDKATRLITSRQTAAVPPNYMMREVGARQARPITNFRDPHPQLSDVQKKMVTYKRNDGVQLSGTLYLPPSYKPGERLPMIVWAYPREFTSADTAGQISGSPHTFTRVGGSSHLLLLTQGYAIFDSATMPIIGPGETANDTYVEQLVASAQAAVDYAVESGIADRDRIGVGGHSYGAFMTANLLAHSDIFRAGVARSGAYNRTLTPFGFQAETRTFWEVPDLYARMSPFWHAHKINEPILIIHGEADNNSGTFPIQSERLYMAVKGHGGTARYVTLPGESHGYAARESNLHVVAETLEWFDKHVKNAKPRSTTVQNQIVR
ncbi:MAG TPA: prolyl oligopeptidase family serine peptidase [Vicinamibacterales bacterium]|nr:prolyl oligopeptidase family serine peptidase [Vicinamibacterales bacterium]